MNENDEVVSVGGPVEEIGGQLYLRIPLNVGGKQLANVTKGISEIEDEFLKISIPLWLAEKLKIKSGSQVTVDNVNGKFNIHLKVES